MNKLLKYSLVGLASLIGLIVVAVAIIAATFNPNDYKPLIVKMVKDKKQRTLNIEGDIKLAFWPKLGADLGKITLSEHNGEQEFAGMESAKVFVAVLPLLKKQLVVDTVKIDGVHANIVRFKDGSTNFDDLMSHEEDSAEIKFDIDGVQIANAAVNLNDEMGNRHFSISDMTLKTGHVAKNQPVDLQASFAVKGDNPAINAKMQLKGTLLMDAEHKQYGAKGLDFALQGDVTALKGVDLKLSGDIAARPEQMEFTVDGLKLALKANLSGQMTSVELDAPSLVSRKDEVSGKEAHLTLTQTKGDDTLSAKLVIADLKGSPKAFQSSGISGDISSKQGARKIASKFSSPFSGNLDNLVFDLPRLAGNVDVKDPALPNGAMQAQFNIAAHVDVKQEQAKVALNAIMDGSKLKGNVGIAHFKKPLYTFDIDIDRIDADRYAPASDAKTVASGPAKPLDLSALKALNAAGSLRIGSLKYGKVQSSNIRIDLKADGEKLKLDPFSAKIDDSQVKAVLGITRFQNPQFSFDVDIDRLDADRYVTKKAPAAKSTADTPLDLSALKSLNASGEARLGWLKVANIKTSNVRLGLKADGGLVALAPFSANLYDGSMTGTLNLDARATPAISFKQAAKGINIGPLLVDALNNDMLEGRGSLTVDVKTQGATVGALKKALNGNASIMLADGAVKGIDIAGTLRDLKGKFNFTGNTLGADQKKRTDFSEMSASFKISNGVAHNDDLSMKSPLLRIAGSGDIDIGNEKLNYTARPTVVASLKGQGGADLGALNGLTFPVKVTGTFSDPKYGLDFNAIATEIAKKNLLGKVGGEKGAAVQKLIGGDTAGALEGLIGGKKKTAEPAAADGAGQPAPAEQSKPATPEEKAKKKLNKLLGF